MEEKQKIDLLKRRKFISRIVKLIETNAQNNGHRVFAIDGEWGLGKTWVLEEIEKTLSSIKEQDKKPYLVIHYNCWEYDYYEEPFIAIVSALLNFVESTKILPSRTKGAVKKVFSKIGKKLLSVGSSLVQPFIGVNIEKAVNEIRDISSESKKEEREKYSFDKFYDFKETIIELKNEFIKLAEKYSIVICVDELDRCLPEYAIKVLERLHHVFEGVNNLQVVLSIDKNQLDKTVKTIFGESVNVAGYLTKFIDFTIKLPRGKIDKQRFELVFSDYVDQFSDNPMYNTVHSINEFINEIFANTNIRRQIKILEKAKLVHSLTIEPERDFTPDDFAVEIVLTMVSFIYEDLERKFNVELENFEQVIDLKLDKELSVIYNKVFDKNSNCYAVPQGENDWGLFNVTDTWALLFVVLLKQYSSEKIKYELYKDDYYRERYVNQIIKYSKQFFDTLKLLS